VDFTNGEIITTPEEQGALRQGDHEARDYARFPIGSVLQVEEMVRERILDKQSRTREMQESGEIHTDSAKFFSLRTEINILHGAHDDILTYCMQNGSDIPT
jgi:hypothetical protein